YTDVSPSAVAADTISCLDNVGLPGVYVVSSYQETPPLFDGVYKSYLYTFEDTGGDIIHYHIVYGLLPGNYCSDTYSVPIGQSCLVTPQKALGSGNTDPAASGCVCSGTPNNTGSVKKGEPIDIGSGNVFYTYNDYGTSGSNTLSFSRYYNSQVNGIPYA